MEIQFLKSSSTMRKAIILLSIFLISISFSCKQNDENFDPTNPLIGTWVYENSEYDPNIKEWVSVYVRKFSFEENKSGLLIGFSNHLIQRDYRFNFYGQNIPICGNDGSYRNIDGTWNFKNEILTLNSDNTKTDYRVVINTVSVLKIKKL
jgi:hypothetical protein